MRKKRRGFAVVLVLGCIIGLGTNANGTTVDEAKQAGSALEEQKETAEAEKESLTDQLNGLISQMQKTQQELSEKETEIATAEEELATAKVKENEQYQSMKKRIQYVYEEGDYGLLAVILEADSLADFINRVEFTKDLSEYDRNMLVEFQETVAKVQETEETLQTEYVELENLQNSLAEQKATVETLLAEKNLEISNLEAQIGENAALLNELVAQAEAAAKAAQQAKSATYSSSAGASVVTGNGRFTHPCPGTYLSSGFGYRTYDNSFHKGYDYASNGVSMPVYAADSGTVVIAGWSNSAGNWIVINHGDGLVTKYMHLSVLYVQAGDTVTKGQNIGMSGTTGSSSGVHLHFQVELNGTAVDPGLYL